MAGKLDWCSQFNKHEAQYHFCSAAEEYIKNELEDIPSKGKRKKKKVFMEFEMGLAKFFDSVKENSEFANKIIKLDKTSQIYKDGVEELKEAAGFLKSNCSKIDDVIKKELNKFEEKVKLYFLENEKYSNDNRLPTNYSALAVLFTKFFSNKGAFDGVNNLKLNWDEIAKSWITHSFHPHHTFLDIRPDDEKIYKLSNLNFSELARIYFSNDTVFDSEGLRKSVRFVLDSVRQLGFDTEDRFERLYLQNRKNTKRYAKDFGFVDMFTGIDFIYQSENGLYIPIQVKSSMMQPTYLISTLGCKTYVIAEKQGQKFKIKTDQEQLPY